MGAIDYDLKKIKGIAFDVDGVLSPSTIPLSSSGEPLRLVNIKDGYALQHAVKEGLNIAIITGGNTHGVRVRYEGLGIKDIYMGASMKLPIFRTWLQEHGLKPEEVAFVGDDIPDIPVLREAGLSICPSDAAPEVKAVARYISPVEGGMGVARDVISQIMKSQDTWMHCTEAFGW